MRKMQTFRRAAGVTGVALAIVAATGSAAVASPRPGVLCRAATDAGVHRTSDGRWIYTIAAGHDMRVHEVWQGQGFTLFFGHGAGHETDGYTNSAHFSSCRQG
jgi:hypothetical protein